MKPSFYTLFKRGKYYRPHMREVERFAVAAVGFCLQYDMPFRNHFWKKVCWKKGDPTSAEHATIEIEDKNWSDLKIKNGNCVAVVEFKAGARLDSKQNPMMPKIFWNKKGYGREMLNQCKSDVRFTILGYEKDLKLRKGKFMCPQNRGKASGASRRLGVFCCQRSWDDLCKGFD